MSTTGVALALLGGSAAIAVYAYAGYPALLRLLAGIRGRGGDGSTASPAEWPLVTLTLPAYNEAATIRGTLEQILQLDYPRDRLHVVVVSDASTDGTDDIVREYADQGIELVRQPRRMGKTAAENAACRHIRGEIVVNTDASVRIHPDALKPLIRALSDPSVGIASGRDVSVARTGDDANVAESGYVGYEMWVRRLETQIDGIVGASGCFYASRRQLHSEVIPEALSRDFAAPLVARERGYRSVSVDEAVCFVPRTPSLRREYRRKLRTMTRGLETLFFKRHLLNPARYGLFAWMLFSHKLARWLVPWALALATLALGMLAPAHVWARWLLVGGAAAALLALAAWFWPERRSMPRALALPGYVITGTLAALLAWIKALRGELNPIWEPTRRDNAEEGEQLSVAAD